MIMKIKIGWCFFFLMTFLNIESNCQNIPIENPAIKNSDKSYFRYGIGLTQLTNLIDATSIDFELGVQYHLNSLFSISYTFNYGISPEDLLYFQALQAHSSFIGFIAPTRNDKEFVFKMGGGISGLAAYDVYSRNGETRNGLFPGYCIALENGFYSKKKDNYFVLNLMIGTYSNGQNLISFSFLRDIAFSKIKNSRKEKKVVFKN